MAAKLQKSSRFGQNLVSKTMDINSQHHNLLGSQISSKPEDFCILAAIFD
jgi:hypothetical protein